MVAKEEARKGPRVQSRVMEGRENGERKREEEEREKIYIRKQYICRT